MKLSRKNFIKSSLISGLGIYSSRLLGSNKNAELTPPPVCTLVPSETQGPFPSLPSGDSMYWRSNLIDGQAGVQLDFTIQVNGIGNCGVLQGARVDVWHCNADGYYSHYATGGTNNGHSGANPPSGNNATLIYCRGTQVTNTAGQVTFTSIFPGWYPGRTCHIHFAVYTGGTAGSSAGWTLNRVSQFTFPIAAKNALYVDPANEPYNNYGADPLLPDNDNVFSSPSGQWSLWQLGSLVGTAPGPYTSFYEVAVEGSGTLPLDLIGFTGSPHGTGSLLWWKTTNEVNFHYFELEYSEDAEDFEFLAKISAKGNGQYSDSEYIYVDTDRLIYGNAYYRLKMIDLDGKYEYSSIISVKTNSDIILRIYPNPASYYLTLQHPESDGSERILILSETGMPIAIGNISNNTQITTVSLDLLKAGVYYLVFEKQSRSQSLKFLKI